MNEEMLLDTTCRYYVWDKGKTEIMAIFSQADYAKALLHAREKNGIVVERRYVYESEKTVYSPPPSKSVEK